MKYFVDNENTLTSMIRLGFVGNFSTCERACNVKGFKPFHLQDFYKFAERLNETSFLYANKTGASDEKMNSMMRGDGERDIDGFEMCTDVQFDFKKRKWTDGRALEQISFITNWENKFDQFWENIKHEPPQPYQPEIVSIIYKISTNISSNINSTISRSSIAISSVRPEDEMYRQNFKYNQHNFIYKCLNRNQIKLGTYSDGINDCNRSNSSLQTYFIEVDFHNFEFK